MITKSALALCFVSILCPLMAQDGTPVSTLGSFVREVPRDIIFTPKEISERIEKECGAATNGNAYVRLHPDTGQLGLYAECYVLPYRNGPSEGIGTGVVTAANMFRYQSPVAQINGVVISVQPIPMKVKESLFGKIDNVGLWQVDIASTMPTTTVITDTVLRMNAPEVGFMSRPLALKLFQDGGNRGKWATAAFIAAFAMETTAGVFVSDVIKVSDSFTQAAVLGTPVLRKVYDWMASKKDAYDSFEQFICPSQIPLAPKGQVGSYYSCMAFARIQKGAVPHQYTISLE